MQLTRYAGYGLRVLIYVAMLPEGKRANIDEISEFYSVSRNIINKIVHQLGREKVIKTFRGKGGGFILLMAPEDISIGVMMSKLENTFEVMNCTYPAANCKISSLCKLKTILNQATVEFIATLNRFTLADLIIKMEGETP